MGVPLPPELPGKFYLLPELINLNRLESRPRLIDRDGVDFSDSGETSCWYFSLNGQWRFSFLRCPEDAPEGFVRPDFDDSGWTSLPVPSNWQMKGFGHPHYTNVKMPFRATPPAVPSSNPTGLYRKEVSVAKNWLNRRTVLHFGGAESVLCVWLNGKFVGLSKGSRLPAEFEITSELREGKNLIAVMVVQWSDASYLEDQDHWWLAGIFREVFLRSTPPVRIDDIFAEPLLEKNLSGAKFRFRARLGFPDRPEEGWTVTVRLTDPKGHSVWSEPWTLEVDAKINDETRKWWQLEGVRPVAAPLLWSHENPNLYRAHLELCFGEIVYERHAFHVGFRRLEITGRSLLINGQRVLIKGVNLHDHHDREGRAVPRETMEADVRLMKRLNMNAIRCSHYPADCYLYELCDRHGLYVIDEADIECHAFRNSLADDPRYAAAWLDRGMRMVQRDKNHACIIAWSLGNESGYGASHDALAGWIRRYDPNRLIHYEGATREMNWAWGATGAHRPDYFSVTDLICPMYPPLERLVEVSAHAEEPRPCIVCEFSHAMGNANGNLREYFELFESMPGLQGGFIWEWVDHGLVKVDPNGREFWAYGGDFGDTPHDANFVADGLVWPDRTPHPAAFEFKKLAQPLRLEAIDGTKGVFRLHNKQSFTSLEWLKGSWVIESDGLQVASGLLPALDVCPGDFWEFSLDPDAMTRAAAQAEETFIRFSFSASREESFCPAGEEMAWEQFLLFPARKMKAESPDRKPDVALKCEMDEASGLWRSWAFHGQELLISAPTLNLWRCPTDNDGLRLLGPGDESKALTRWIDAGYDQVVLEKKSSTQSTSTADLSVFTTTHNISLKGCIRGALQLSWQILPDARLRCDARVELDEDLPDLPRVGLTLSLPGDFERVFWFGRGPWETYCDRKTGGWISRFESTVTDQFVPYLLPQEHGNHTDVRWFELSTSRGKSVRFEYDFPMEFSVSHFSAADLMRARHPGELTPRNETIVNIDFAQRGLGNAACGNDALKQYRLPAGNYNFSFTISFS